MRYILKSSSAQSPIKERSRGKSLSPRRRQASPHQRCAHRRDKSSGSNHTGPDPPPCRPRPIRTQQRQSPDRKQEGECGVKSYRVIKTLSVLQRLTGPQHSRVTGRWRPLLAKLTSYNSMHDEARLSVTGLDVIDQDKGAH
ncbi:hypothetical protein CRUP_024450 [Coryphaenoides rupestris]|nr:hypothetical protein CRUP_024450 [Coryphaenoides rupestris]